MQRNQSNLVSIEIESPLNVSTQLILGYYLIVILFMCLLINILFLVVYMRSREIKNNPTGIFIAAITILNLISATSLPLKIHSLLNGRFFTLI